ncbi:MAG: ABC transporter permease [Anaerolineae bacterium]
MNEFLAIIKKELRAIARERTILIAIVIQLFIASFSSALLIGLLSIYDPNSMTINANVPLRVGIMGDTATPLAGFLRERSMRIVPLGGPDDAAQAFQTGKVDLVLQVPPDNGGAMNMQMFLPRSEVISSFIQIFMHEPLKKYENYLRQERGIVVNFTDLTGKPSTTFEFLYSVLVPLLMFFPAFVAGSLVIDSLSEELETHTLETLWSAPLSINTILAAKIGAALAVAMLQILLWLALLRVNQIDIQNIGLVFLLATFSAAILITICAFIAMLLRDRERSQFLYSIFMLTVGSLSYLIASSPLQLVTRLSIGDYYTGVIDVAKYGLILAALLFVLFRFQRRLISP